MLFRFSLYGFLKNQQYYDPFLTLAFLEKGLSFFQEELPFDNLLRGSRKIRENILTNYYYDTIIHEHCDVCAPWWLAVLQGYYIAILSEL